MTTSRRGLSQLTLDRCWQNRSSRPKLKRACTGGEAGWPLEPRAGALQSQAATGTGRKGPAGPTSAVALLAVSHPSLLFSFRCLLWVSNCVVPAVAIYHGPRWRSSSV